MQIIMENESYKLEIFNILKVNMMLVIILYHSIALWLPDGWFNQNPIQSCVIFENLSQYLNFVHTYVFVFTSGYIFSWLKINKGKYSSIQEVVHKKFERLMYPYFIVALIWCIPFYVVFYETSIRAVFLNYVLGYSPSQLWFLPMLFWIFIVSYLLFDYIRGWDIVKMIMFLPLCYLVAVIASAFVTMPYQILMSFKYLPFFMLGMNYDKIMKYVQKRKIWIINLFLSVLCFSIWKYWIVDEMLACKLIKWVFAFMISIFGVLSVVGLFYHLRALCIWKSKLFLFLETYNFYMYLFHQQIIWITITYTNGKINPYFMAILNFFISIGISSCIAVLMSRVKRKIQFYSVSSK